MLPKQIKQQIKDIECDRMRIKRRKHELYLLTRTIKGDLQFDTFISKSVFLLIKRQDLCRGKQENGIKECGSNEIA